MIPSAGGDASVWLSCRLFHLNAVMDKEVG
jgi:hypothetical protein